MSQQIQAIDEDFRYGQLAIEGRLITPDQFDTAMDKVRDSRKPLADILVSDGVMDATTADRLSKALRRIMRDERAKSEGGVLMKKQIGGYKLVRRIGEGGMGEVYLAEQLNMHRQVALKILHAKWSDDEEFRKRFLLEARAVGKLSHQNLIGVYDVGKYQGLYYFSMEYIDGVTADDLIRHDGQIAIEKCLDICLQVCQALRYLSSQHIVHRDIKPANIMLTKEGVVKLGDFGFIQAATYDKELSQEGTTIGTPDYISPEQARGERDLDVRSDIYSLGATLFHMLTGRTLYTGSCSQVMRDHIETDPPKLAELRKDVPPELQRMLAKMIAKLPLDRHQSSEELIKDLNLVKLAITSDDKQLPNSRSAILDVIQAEKERMTALQRQVTQLEKHVWMWRAVALIALIAVVIVLLLPKQ